MFSYIKIVVNIPTLARSSFNNRSRIIFGVDMIAGLLNAVANTCENSLFVITY